MITTFRNACIALTATVLSSAALADGEGGSGGGLDLTGVETAVSAAKADAGTVGGWVIGAVAVLAAIGVIIAIVKKI